LHLLVVQALQFLETKLHTAAPRGSVRAKPLNETAVGKNGGFRSFLHNISETEKDMTHVTINQ